MKVDRHQRLEPEQLVQFIDLPLIDNLYKAQMGVI